MRILLPTDGSEYSETAARYLTRLGFGPGTEITVMHALKEYLLPDSLDPARDFIKAGRHGAERLVEGFKAMLATSGASVRTLVREGTPWVEIIEGAEEVKPDLVVMGHKGLTGITRFLMGSVAHQVVRHSPFSTLIVRELPPAERPMRVLYATDGSYSARYARDLMALLPLRDDTLVNVLSVADIEVSSMEEKYYPDEDISVMMEILRGHYREMSEKAVAEDSLALGKRFKDVRGHVAFGVPEFEILKAAEWLQADLVVMGSKGLHGLKGVLLGSSSLRVMRQAECSVLIAKIPGK